MRVNYLVGFFSRRTFFLFTFLSICYLFNVLLLFFPLNDCITWPLLKFDYAHHYSNVDNAIDYFINHFDCWGFSPLLEGGMLEPQGVSNRLLVIIGVVFRFLPFHIVFNVSIFLMIASIPFLVVWSSVNLYQFSKGRMIQSFLLVWILVLWTEIGKQFVWVGHFGFLFSSALLVLSTSFLVRYFRERRPWLCYVSAIIISIALWGHAVIVIPTTIIIIFIIWTERKHITKLDLTHFTRAGFFIVILPNLFWAPTLLQYLLFFHQENEMSNYLQSDWKTLSYYLTDFPTVIMMYFGLTTLVISFFKRSDKWATVVLYSGLVLAILFCFGSNLFLGDAQPIRFIIPLFMLLAVGPHDICWRWMKVTRVVILLSVFVSAPFAKSNYTSSIGCGFKDDRALTLMSFLDKSIDRRYRLHVQGSVGTPYFDMRIISLIPKYYNIQTLAGSLPFPSKFEQFVDDYLFGRTIDLIKADELRFYILLYNIGYFLIHSDSAEMRFSKSELVKKVYQDQKISLYEVLNKSSGFCFNCEAQVIATNNKIVVSDVKSEEIVLKYHYFDRLGVNSDKVLIGPIYIDKDPIPFIKLKFVDNYDSDVIIKRYN